MELGGVKYHDPNQRNLTMIEAMEMDRSKHTILPLSKFGLLQITRQSVRPELNIKLLKPRPIKISIIGEIKRPGFYTIGDKGTRNISGKNRFFITND